MRVLVALLEIERVGLAVGGRPAESDFNLVVFFLVAYNNGKSVLRSRESIWSKKGGI